MLELIIDFIKDKNKGLTYCILMVALTLYISSKYWKFVQQTYRTIYKILIIFMHHIISIVFIIVILIGIKIIFNLSDKKSKENIDNYYKKPLILDLQYNRYFRIELIERYERLNEKYGDTLKVIIKNIMNSDIDHIKGSIFLYDENKVRVKNIKLETKNLQDSYSDLVFYNLIDMSSRNWKEFDVYIDEFRIGDVIQENFNIQGKKAIRTQFLTLNYLKFYDYKIFGINTKYNLVWIKEKIKYEFLPSISFFYSKKEYYRDRCPLYIELKDLLKRLIRFLVVIFVTILIVSLIIIALIDVEKMFISIFQILKTYFQKIPNYM
ncbi:hypothetical protein [Clostridium tyrobutyricum]|uniref:hypothetical protein n=1 Tax=Clostridium tyrobutyricum TaxID=1519 RepID=UPI001C391065|nr:hypothetical protein [Clostridium tyrobutyricum]MBV4429548.1 hypothetical protein [Clostridium tyrobutyricum]MBV4444769.1 hypothetical protein [Clostridium tyrobutyricum]